MSLAPPCCPPPAPLYLSSPPSDGRNAFSLLLPPLLDFSCQWQQRSVPPFSPLIVKFRGVFRLPWERTGLSRWDGADPNRFTIMFAPLLISLVFSISAPLPRLPLITHVFLCFSAFLCFMLVRDFSRVDDASASPSSLIRSRFVIPDNCDSTSLFQ